MTEWQWWVYPGSKSLGYWQGLFYDVSKNITIYKRILIILITWLYIFAWYYTWLVCSDWIHPFLLYQTWEIVNHASSFMFKHQIETLKVGFAKYKKYWYLREVANMLHKSNYFGGFSKNYSLTSYINNNILVCCMAFRKYFTSCPKC